MAGQSDNLGNLVRQVVSHPCFQDAVNSASQHTDACSSTSCETITPRANRSEPSSASLEVLIPRAPAVSSDNQHDENGARRTPREELQSLFRRARPSFQQSPDLPQFQRRTSWGPSPSSRSRSGSRGKPYRTSSGNKSRNPAKKTTFSLEVVLLRRPGDSMV